MNNKSSLLPSHTALLRNLVHAILPSMNSHINIYSYRFTSLSPSPAKFLAVIQL